MRHSFALAPFLAVAAAAIPALAGDAPAGDYAPWIGKEAPAFRLESVDGKEVSLADYRGKLVVIHFGASWCPFCNAEAPHLESLWKSYRDKGVQVLVVDVGESKKKVRKWVSANGVSFPVLLDADGKAARAWAPAEAQPDLARDQVVLASNAIVDRDGKLAFFSLLDSTRFDAKLVSLRARLDELLKDGESRSP